MTVELFDETELRAWLVRMSLSERVLFLRDAKIDRFEFDELRAGRMSFPDRVVSALGFCRVSRFVRKDSIDAKKER